jgi:hypothetical protein
MVFGNPLRVTISRKGRASPAERKAERIFELWTTDLTRYGSRPCGAEFIRTELIYQNLFCKTKQPITSTLLYIGFHWGCRSMFVEFGCQLAVRASELYILQCEM